MTIPVFTCLVLGATVFLGGSWIVSFGRARLARAATIHEKDVCILGLIHLLVGAWFVMGAVTADPNTTLGACLLMTKVRYCMADAS